MPYKNKEQLKAYQQEYAAKNEEKLKKYKQDWFQSNKEHIYENNKEFLKAWKELNKDRVKTYDRKYKNNNKEFLYKKNVDYKKNRRKNDELYRLAENIRVAIIQTIKRNGFKKKCRTQTILGCSFDEFKTHIESQWESWMSWENYGKYEKDKYNVGWDIDHITPISSAKTEEDLYKLNHYTNLQPLCSKVNRDIKKDN